MMTNKLLLLKASFAPPQNNKETSFQYKKPFLQFATLMTQKLNNTHNQVF